MKHTLVKLSFCSSLLFCAGINADIKPQPTLPLEVGLAKSVINIDGKVDAVWQQAKWQPLDKLILGEQPSSQDFSGRYKLLWQDNQLFLLAEIIDDVLLDKTADPKVAYWDDDCLEIFIDPDASGGEHQANHNAFAYHVALDNQVADYGLQNEAILLNDHVESRWMRDQKQPNIIYWEAAITLYPQSYNDLLAADHKDQAKPLALNSGDIIGFMLAYCDNDGSAERESFIGSHEITPINGDKNLGYKNADVFGKIKLVD